MRILITGSNGQLGNEIRVLAEDYPDFEFIYTDIDELDISNPLKVDAFFTANKPLAVINCAAYTAVDKAETDKNLAYLINCEAEVVNEVTLVASVGEPEANVRARDPPDILAPLDSEIVPAELRVTEVLPVRSWLSAMSPLLIVVSETTGTETAAVLVIEPPVAFTVRDESVCATSAMPPALFIVSA